LKVDRYRIHAVSLPTVKVRLAQQKGPLAVCASAGLVDPDGAFLVHRTGHSRQHAQCMMMMVAMVERNKHLHQG
jgi:hypothetical protein